ncbi:MAG: hypothetical protein SVJ22_08030 [Halobacteriota archaeon]|nr:hypothetical protein [Halobacteriota archaeon]
MSQMSLKDDESGQIIAAVGFAITISIVLFATVYHSAGLAGYRTVEQGLDDVSYVYNNVRGTYGHILNQLSDNGTVNPFTGAEYNELQFTHEPRMKKLLNARGFILSISDHNCTLPYANVTIVLSDGTTKYIDHVTYDLRTGNVI